MTAAWFFVAHCVARVLLTTTDIGGSSGFGPLGALLFGLATYVVMLVNLAYGIGALMLMRRENAIGRAFYGINMTLHFLFVTDVVSAVLVVELARHLLGLTQVPKAWSETS